MGEGHHINERHEELIKDTAEAARNFGEQLKSQELAHEQHVLQLEKNLVVAPEHSVHIETAAQHFKEEHSRVENQLLKNIDDFVEKELTLLTKEKFINLLLVRVEELVGQDSHEDVLTYLFLKAKHKYQSAHSAENVDYAA